MTEVLPVVINGHKVYVEVDPRYGSEDTSSDSNPLQNVGDTFERAKITITDIANQLVGAVKAMDAALTPDEFSFEFQIKFTVEGNVVLAKMGTEANLKVSMVYKHKS